MHKTTKVIAAAAVGFAAGILLAPKSGDQTRKDLKRKAHEAKRYAAGKMDEAQDVMDDVKDDVKRTVGFAKSEAEEMQRSSDAASRRISREAEALREEAKSRGNRVASDAKRTVASAKKEVEKRTR